jgi:hypothetical protein
LWHNDLGAAELCLGRVDAAVPEFRRAIDGGLHVFFAYMFLAAAEALLGNDAAAKTAIAEARRLNRQLTLKWLAANMQLKTLELEGLRGGAAGGVNSR